MISSTDSLHHERAGVARATAADLLHWSSGRIRTNYPSHRSDLRATGALSLRAVAIAIRRSSLLSVALPVVEDHFAKLLHGEDPFNVERIWGILCARACTTAVPASSSMPSAESILRSGT